VTSWTQRSAERYAYWSSINALSDWWPACMPERVEGPGHPLQRLRPKLNTHRFATAQQLSKTRDGPEMDYCGIVTLRQQPESAKGVM
jgi:hypothetical protein